MERNKIISESTGVDPNTVERVLWSYSVYCLTLLCMFGKCDSIFGEIRESDEGLSITEQDEKVLKIIRGSSGKQALESIVKHLVNLDNER
jgi:hypothetical protein